MKAKIPESGEGAELFAHKMTDFFGSVGFLIGFLCFLVFWIGWNLGHPRSHGVFDPFPFPALEMIVSVFAIVLSISVLISQRRQARQQKINQQIEFEVNVRAETEITKMLKMLHEIQRHLGIDSKDEELETMKEHLDLNQLEQELKAGDEGK